MRFPSPSSSANRCVRRVAAVLAAALAAGCGDPAAGPAPGPPAPVIVKPPADTAVFQGQTAAFQVLASGSALTYKWSRDGVPIPGATDSHYVTLPTAPGDDAATYRVAVEANGSAPTVSSAARLTVYQPLDLRFQWVGSPVALTFVRLWDLLGPETLTAEGVGAPLLVGEGLCAPAPPVANCIWNLAWNPGVRGVQTIYHAGLLAEFGPGWVNALPPGALVTSLDLEEGASAFAASVVQSTQTGTFTPRLGSVALDQLPATASAEGALGRVLTAVSFQGGLVTYLSYAWSEAPDTRYEAQVVATSVSGAGSAATALAAQGYVITAFGAGNSGSNGVVMVGTRRQGDTAPRDVLVQVTNGYFSTPPGYAAVGYLIDLVPFTISLILER